MGRSYYKPRRPAEKVLAATISAGTRLADHPNSVVKEVRRDGDTVLLVVGPTTGQSFRESYRADQFVEVLPR